MDLTFAGILRRPLRHLLRHLPPRDQGLLEAQVGARRLGLAEVRAYAPGRNQDPVLTVRTGLGLSIIWRWKSRAPLDEKG